MESVDDLIEEHLRALAGLYAARNGRCVPEVRLSARELEVATLAAATPLTYAEMAARLFVSESTIKTLLQRCYAKLGIRRRHQMQDALRTAGGVR
jgi:DNA-binding CsgD family transcriptional regulator